MIYISPENNYPRYIGDIQLDVPSWKIGDPLPEGWREVSEAPKPEHADGFIAYEDTPVEIDGVMTQNWVVRELTLEEIARRDAPKTAKAKLEALGFSDVEIEALVNGLVR